MNRRSDTNARSSTNRPSSTNRHSEVRGQAGRCVGVFASSSESLEPAFYREAHKLGRLLAQAGLGIVFGGGITASWATWHLGQERQYRAEALAALSGLYLMACGNRDTVLKMPMKSWKQTAYPSENALMEEKSDGFVVLPGGIGTLDEFFSVLGNRQLGFHSKPVAVVNFNGFYDSLAFLMEDLYKKEEHQSK